MRTALLDQLTHYSDIVETRPSRRLGPLNRQLSGPFGDADRSPYSVPIDRSDHCGHRIASGRTSL